jgi:hypothetical protein
VDGGEDDGLALLISVGTDTDINFLGVVTLLESFSDAENGIRWGLRWEEERMANLEKVEIGRCRGKKWRAGEDDGRPWTIKGL